MILTDNVTALRLDDLVANPLNPRAELGEVDELAASIRELGLLQPLLVVEIGGDPCGEGGTHMVIDGHRRFAALQLLDFDDEIPVRVVDDPGTAGRLLIALSAGMHGRPLAPLDEARAFQSLVDLDMTQRQIAERVGCNQSHVSKRLSLLALDDDKAQALSEGKIKVRDAERVARGKPEPVVKVAAILPDSEALRELAGRATKANDAAVIAFGRNEELKAQLATAQKAYDDTREERDRYREHSALCNQISWRIAEALGKVGPDDDAVVSNVVEDLEELIRRATPHATIPAGQEMVSVGAVWDAVDAGGYLTAVDTDDLFPPRAEIDPSRAIQFEADQIDWEQAHPDAVTRPPWPPYRKTPAEGIVKFLTTTINQVNTVRHVIAYESTHEQRQQVLQAAADRLFELS
jgi:ParB/RepB/Spo0J family partition protein